MSWTIHVVQNSLKISKKVAKALFDADTSKEIWDDASDVIDEKGLVTFNEDHQEWMDWLGNNDNLVEVLKKHKAFGIVGFADFEGDNNGSIWGYQFDGTGRMFELKGHIEWK